MGGPALAWYPQEEGGVFQNTGDAILPEAVGNLEKQLIRQALQKSGGNQKKAAGYLGITQRMLGYKLKTYGLKA